MKTQLRTLIIALFLMASIAQASDSIEVEDAWIPEAPPVATMHAGYLTINNQTKADVRVISLSSDDYKNIEIHKTEMKDGMARMIKQNELPVPAGGSVRFERGGLHLMLMQPVRKLKAGDTVRIDMVTSDNQTHVFTAKVKPATLDNSEQHHEHHHHQ